LTIEQTDIAAYICDGTGSIIIQAIDGIEPYTYSITAHGTTSPILASNNDGRFMDFGEEGASYDITITDACGTSITVMVTMLNIAHTTLAYTINDGVFCEGSVVHLNAISLGEATYSWTGPNGFASDLQRPRFLALYPDSEGWYDVMIIPEGCATGKTESLYITVNTVPEQPAAITGNAIVCAGSEPLTYSIAAVTDADAYTWSVPTGWTINTGQGTTTITATPTASAQSGDITVTADNDCGSGVEQTLAVTVAHIPATPGAISGATSVWVNEVKTYQIEAVAEATSYTWAFPAGWTIVSGQGTAEITVTAPASEQNSNISVTANNDCGSSLPKTLAVTVTEGIPVLSVEITNCPENGLLHINTGLQMQMQILPEDASNQDVIWSSSNFNAAIVDQTGYVTPMKVGTTTITVTTVSGGHTASCSIQVVNPVTGIQLNKQAISLFVNAEETLVATVLPSNATVKNVVWSSAAPAIATVDQNGKVKGIAEGATVVTVTTLDGGFTASCNVTVKAESYITPTGITVTPTTLSLDRGKTYQLTATVKPAGADPTVIWSSSNTTIVEVDSNGVLTGKAAGKATITAKTINGYSSTCTVTVTIPVESIVVDPATCTIPLKGAKVLKATVYPSDASSKTVTWSSSNTAIATVSSTGTVTAKSVNGTVEIYAAAANGVFGVCVVTVGSGGVPMGIKETDIESITIYPNPTSGELQITSYELQVTGIEIFDMMGRKVQSPMFNVQGSETLNVKPETLNFETVTNISHLPTGVYFLRIQTETGVVIRKVIKN
jgi:uncharacterized protein YjdB